MSARDAVVRFECSEPDFVQVSEEVGGEVIRHRELPRHGNVVGELEELYMFFADQADVARKKVSVGQSCEFTVYFREP